MQSKTDRKEAIRKFKERKPPAGVFAIRCTATGRIWVGSTPNLQAAKNRDWFCLRNGGHPEKALQEEWTTHGEQAFQFEILEALDDKEVDDLPAFGVKDLLKKKQQHWTAQLGAGPLLF